MSTWTLVMTILAASTQGGSSIHDVSGFSTLAECQAAGLVWAQQVSAKKERAHVITTCMEQIKP